MVNRKFFCRLAFCLIVASSQAHAQKMQALNFQFDSVKINDKIPAYIVVLDQQAMTAKVVGFDKNNRSGISPRGAFYDTRCSVVLGSGYVVRYYPVTPNGFLKIDRKTINPVNMNSMDATQKGYSTIVGVMKGKIKIFPRNGDPGAVEEGIQVGPTLVTNGHKDGLAHQHATRAFIGITYDNKILVGITTDRIDLNDIATFLANPPGKYAHMKCNTAVNLSGGGAEALIVKAGAKTFYYGNVELKGASQLTFK